MPTFYRASDYDAYRTLLSQKAQQHGVRINVYCLLPNHVHHSATPASEDSLARAFGQSHWHYAWRINRRQGWTGHLWQERFYSCAMDDQHAWLTARYILTNPVRAGLVPRPEDWPYSSARFHLGLVAEDPLVSADPAMGPHNWAELLALGSPSETERDKVRHCTRSGVPLGSCAFVSSLERALELDLSPKRRGRPPMHSRWP